LLRRRRHWERAAAADEYGFNTFTYGTGGRFRHDAFMALFDDWDVRILRAKGFVRFSAHPPTLISVVRDALEIQVFTDEAEIEDDDASTAKSDWDEPETEIVFIGQGMPAEQLITRLDACLVDPPA
jgi:G3E family GTPase